MGQREVHVLEVRGIEQEKKEERAKEQLKKA